MTDLVELASRLSERQALMWMAPDKHGKLHQLVDASDLADAIDAVLLLAHQGTAHVEQ